MVSKDSSVGIIVAAVVASFAAMIAFVANGGGSCSDDGGSIATCNADIAEMTRAEGWEKAEPTGYKFFSCGKEDFYHTGFKAVKNGTPISGTICRGLFLKGATVRYD